MKRTLTAFALILSAALGGCSMAVKEAVHTVRGSQAKVIELKRPPILAQYDSIKVLNFTNDMGRVVPQNTANLIAGKINERVFQETLLNVAGQRTLLISGKIVYLEMQNMGSGMLSPFEEVVCYVYLGNSEKTVIGQATIAGRNESRVRAASNGLEEVADGVAKGVVRWLTENGVARRPKEHNAH